MLKRVFRAGPATILFALVVTLVGCDGGESPSDGTSPDHIIKLPKSQGKYRYGITDTLGVEFSENIDTAALDLRFTDSAGIGWQFQGSRKLVVFGTRSTFGTRHFPVNTPFTLTLSGLRDRAGNGHPAIDIPFLPWTWADRDYLDSTYDWSDSLYGDTGWVDGSPLSDTLVAEGALDYKQNVGRVDRNDFKLLRVAAPDTILVTLATRATLNLRMTLSGPFLASSLDSVIRHFDFNAPVVSLEGSHVQTRDSTANRGVAYAKLVTELEDHKPVLGSFDAPGIYVIWLRVPEENEGFYRLKARIGRKYL